MTERRHRVMLHGRTIGTLNQKNDYTRFLFDSDYWTDDDRAVLGLQFEDNPQSSHASSLRVPPWFSNLLPEGRLREWIAADRGVPSEREMELLLQVGHDLPGAVRIVPDDRDKIHLQVGRMVDKWDRIGIGEYGGRLRFSLAGVSLKFSMLQQGDRLTLPASGEHGDWIVKFPDSYHAKVPQNEFAMMTWAKLVGIDTPDVRLYHRDELSAVPTAVWPNDEFFGYAIRRFDRAPTTRQQIHVEDLAQVRGFYPEQKYQGSFETVAGLLYRGKDLWSLMEFARRLTFSLLIGNGDSHLKNWSVIYPDRRTPQISPAYDLVSTAPYFPKNEPEDIGLKFGSSRRRFDTVRLADFTAMSRRLGIEPLAMEEIVRHTAIAALETWPAVRELLTDLPWVQSWIDGHLPAMASRLGLAPA